MPNYPVPYQPTWNYSGIGQQFYPQLQGTQMQFANQPVSTAMQNQNGMGIKWVDGEVGAKAYQLPAGWPPNQPIALWDTNDTVIYLKSINPMGMPNPLQKANYRLEGVNSGEKDTGYSGNTEPKCNHDMSEYVKKEDLERMRQDLIDTIGQIGTSGTGVRRAREVD